ncbi:60s acidic ribosomal protein-domain-containing protein [Aspergillus pseudodeflectus]|uniref:60s acidic ribosomal protein-domain-containing protein n=1 Tax=Aspergillus pseudodeflectus TaxID=176178 RepID=A0ABR4KGB0_9EURO
MKHLAAYLLLTLAGNTTPTATDIKEVLGSVGIDADEERLAQLLSELQGKEIDELIAEGSKKLATGIGSAPAPGSGAAGAENAADAEVRDELEIEGGHGDDCGCDDEDFGLGLFE